MSQPLRAPKPPDGEEQKAISAILQRDAAMRAKLAEVDGRRSKQRRLGAIAAVVLGAVALYLWLGNPPFLRTRHEAAPPPSQLQAGARFTLYLLGCRIEEYRRKHGHPPDDLTMLGSVPDHVGYLKRTNDYYVLSYDGVQPPIRFDSEFGNLGQLAGASLQVMGTIAEEKTR